MTTTAPKVGDIITIEMLLAVEAKVLEVYPDGALEVALPPRFLIEQDEDGDWVESIYQAYRGNPFEQETRSTI
jgi:hypothetical protein